jgi:hypothetical protein
MSDGRRRCVSDCGSGGWGFESLRARKKVLVRAGPQGPAFSFGFAYVTQRDRDTLNKQEPGEGLTDQVGMAAWWPKTLTRADSLGGLCRRTNGISGLVLASRVSVVLGQVAGASNRSCSVCPDRSRAGARGADRCAVATTRTTPFCGGVLCAGSERGTGRAWRDGPSPIGR